MNRTTTTGITSLLIGGALLGGTVAVAQASPVSAHSAGANDRSEHAGQPSRARVERMTDAWLKLWNGDYGQAKSLIATDFRVHAALLDGGDGSAVKGPEGLVAMVQQIRAAFPDLRFSVQVGPIIDGHQMVVRWTATGTYGGGFPGASAKPGTVVTFTGTDILRIKNGRFVEYWLNADTLLLVTQLQVTAG
jgi:predicted ester cyclase